MKTRFPEHELGKGTLGYHGETQEYYDSKKGLWAVTRWVVAGVLIALGAAFLVASLSPVVDATVVSSTEKPTTGTALVVVRTADGAVGAVTMALAATPSAGSAMQVQVLPLGGMAPYDGAPAGRSTAVVLLATGFGVLGFSLYRLRHPKPVVTTVIAPDDAYDRSRRG